MQIKEFEAKFSEEIIRLAKESVGVFCSKDYPMEQINFWKEKLIPDLLTEIITKTTDFVGFVAIENDEICGVCFLDLVHCKIKGLYVLPKVARQGVGKKLMLQVEAIAKSKGIKELTLDASTNAIEFYERIGYKNIGTSFCTVPEVPSIKMQKFL